MFCGSAIVSPFLTAIARDSVFSDTQQTLVRALTAPAPGEDEGGDGPGSATAPQASTANLEASPSGPNPFPGAAIPAQTASAEGLNWQPLYPPPASAPTAPRGSRGLVRSGDTLLSVAQRYGMTVSDLVRLNPGVESASLTPGVQLKVAQTAPMRPHMLLALNPTGSGGLGWPELPSFPQVPSAPMPGAVAGDYIWPTQGVFSSGYGWRWGRMHKGIDLANSTGTPIVAAKEGRVTFSGWHDGGYGYLVEISHADGSITRYGHNSRLLVSQGQEVRQGEMISQMGSTGNSTGPHLHFEIIAPGMGAMNPLSYLPPRA
ncbi:MAG: M23 family metallopeptidase [Cyanobacteria bacterium]|nr:M23 family metallopeptidase [Cyanobacteriota bacterium]